MELLKARSLFLRVAEQFYPTFIMYDKELNSSVSSIYMALFHFAQDGEIEISQAFLAQISKLSKRTVQKSLKVLESLGYIHAIAQNSYDIKKYFLLYSDRVKKIIKEFNIEVKDKALFYPPEEPKQNLHGGYANSAPFNRIKEFKEIKKQKEKIQKEKTQKEISFTGQNCSCVEYDKSQPVVSVELAKQKQTLTTAVTKKEDPKLTETILDRETVSSKLTETISHKETFNSKSTTRVSNQEAQNSRNSDFDILWEAYPIKQNKKQAQYAFNYLAKVGKLPSLAILLEKILHFQEVDRRWRASFIPHLSTFIRGERWLDEVVIEQKTCSSSPLPKFEENQVQKIRNEIKNDVEQTKNNFKSYIYSEKSPNLSTDFSEIDRILDLIKSKWQYKNFQQNILKGFLQSQYRNKTVFSYENIKIALNQAQKQPENILDWISKYRMHVAC